MSAGPASGPGSACGVYSPNRPTPQPHSIRVSPDLFRRLLDLTRAHVGSRQSPPPSIGDDPVYSSSSDTSQDDEPQDEELAGYYANLEIPYGSDLATVRAAWKDLMKKYHPDLHGADPEKQKLAGEITARLTRACQELEAALERGNGRG